MDPHLLWEVPDRNLDEMNNDNHDMNENGHIQQQDNGNDEDGMQLVPKYSDADDGNFGDGSDEEPTNGQMCALIEMVHDESVNATYNAADQLAQGINQSFRHQASVMHRKRQSDKVVHTILLEQQRRLREEPAIALQRQQSLIHESIEQGSGLKDLAYELREVITKLSAQLKAAAEDDTKTAPHSGTGGSSMLVGAVSNNGGGANGRHYASDLSQARNGHPERPVHYPQRSVRSRQQQPHEQQRQQLQWQQKQQQDQQQRFVRSQQQQQRSVRSQQQHHEQQRQQQRQQDQQQQQRDIIERQKAAAMRKHNWQLRRQ